MKYEIANIGYDNLSKMDIDEKITEFETEQEQQAIDIFREILDVLNDSLEDRSIRIPITDKGYVIVIEEIKLHLLKRHISGRLYLFRIEKGKRVYVED